MLIRSQDKQLLLEANCFKIEDTSLYAGSTTKLHIIGTYMSNGRCIEILNKIETCLKVKNKTVFYMPIN